MQFCAILRKSRRFRFNLEFLNEKSVRRAEGNFRCFRFFANKIIFFCQNVKPPPPLGSFQFQPKFQAGGGFTWGGGFVMDKRFGWQSKGRRFEPERGHLARCTLGKHGPNGPLNGIHLITRGCPWGGLTTFGTRSLPSPGGGGSGLFLKT